MTLLLTRPQRPAAIGPAPTSSTPGPPASRGPPTATTRPAPCDDAALPRPPTRLDPTHGTDDGRRTKEHPQ